MTDPIADFLSRIRNAARAHKNLVTAPASRVKWESAKILEREGFLERVERSEKPVPTLQVTLRFVDREPVVRDLKRISKPGRRLYVAWKDIPLVQSGFGCAIVSTSQGIMTGDDACRRRLGGEFIAEIS